jgi:hypothetical protein
VTGVKPDARSSTPLLARFPDDSELQPALDRTGDIDMCLGAADHVPGKHHPLVDVRELDDRARGAIEHVELSRRRTTALSQRSSAVPPISSCGAGLAAIASTTSGADV